ncbi:acyl-coenzyme A diphosphatase FITM2-like [Macrosteles quadrilineatus]|uniref:acyl-coenzyme A diphosphatase FITM2-like n=1 Tax=Macrosteles quadrilineatus TaxID=74068 RepID=UPI0023E338E9|nr:acyl-coenzyme A diphosphatase FITM2-like [Macrosteles quadrilineatus]
MGEDFVTLQSQNGQNMFVIVVVDPSQLKAALHQIPQQAAAYSKIKFYEDEDSSEEGENSKWETKGTKPLPEPSSVSKVILMMILHVCRKIMFMDTRLKVAIYLASLFVISLLADVLPFPKTYFARKDNMFNVYFVKIAWGWTLVLSVPFVVLTSSTYCCGRKDKILKHLIRLGVATFNWFFWVHLFAYIESIVGRCNARGDRFQTKSACLEKGLFWQGFDISGHTFILIHSSLTLIEEARAIIGWDGIEDMLRNEEYSRTLTIKEVSSNPLRNLNTADLDTLKFNYEKYSPYVRGLFIAMTSITILWDVMLLSTMLYFHSMVEKFISGCIAILIWYFTYNFWYPTKGFLPYMPGEGAFKYRDAKSTKEVPLIKKRSVDKGQLPRFMGMPLYGLRNEMPPEKSEMLGNDNGLGLSSQS